MYIGLIKSKENNITKFTITPKNFYNYFKSLTHYNVGKQYLEYNSYQWSCLTDEEQNDFINKLNGKNINNWFSIRKNIENLRITNDPAKYNFLIRELIIGNPKNNNNLISTIIFETLIINGILTQYLGSIK